MACKQGCLNPTGIGIHPEEASVCAAAFIDQSIPFEGGLVGIGIAKGLESYEGGSLKNIDVSGFQKSKRSFVTFKIDNVDMIQSELRILDFAGNFASQGRVDIRLRGTWGSLCSLGANEFTAKTICKELGYASGRLGGACDGYQGNNFCGHDVKPIHFKNIKCQDTDSKLLQCYREMAQDCSHKQDLIVECFNTGPENDATPH